ncbi:Hsp20/alpha crystallin family protein [Plantactinospora sp. KBS50]|uniref:Hsp20/alpha crystallin family protein n=1 Tax=Plantactinospora sp. KBS50 TaxID=2024580 RepID=UPI000BAA9EC2|nr:Hsp20/alpha crystallin family protein [Plantactinospora sp. KBS50]ASW58085.1 heat-shock protein Hsp20 [Plantactinospora sp. KBS50]
MTLPVLRSNTAPADYEPLREFAALQQRMTALLSTVLDGNPLTGTGTGWTPLADVTETDDAYLVEIDLPGVNRRDLTVEVAGHQLRVSGEIVEKEKVGWLRHRTRRVGRFSYQTLLPGGIEAERISADLADGVLSVRVPKTDAARPRRIAVNTG